MKMIRNVTILLVIGIVIVFLTMDYQDGAENALAGYRLCLALFNGTLGELYNNFDFSYGISLYVIYAIWSIPIVLLNIISGNHNVDLSYMSASLGYTYWYKSMLLLFWVATIVVFVKILGLYFKNEITLWVLFLASSPFMVFPPFALTQCDIIGTFFSLLGVYYLLHNNDKQFIFCFAISITMKYLALFLFVPLLLYRYRGWKVIVNGLCAVSLAAFSLLLVQGSNAVEISQNDTHYYVAQKVSDLYTDGKLIIYFAVICLIAIWMNLYKKAINEHKWIIWFSVAGWMTLLVLYSPYLYWYLLISPYLVLLLLCNTQRLKINIGLISLFVNTAILNRIMVHPWVLGGKFTYMLLRHQDSITASMGEDSLYYFFAKLMQYLGAEPWDLYIITRFIVYITAMFILIINIPEVPAILENNSIMRCIRGKYNTNHDVISVQPLFIGCILNVVALYGWIGLCVFTNWYK